MKIMLTSFGIEQALGSSNDMDSLFYRMPPVSFRHVNEIFLPDYELLLLCDSVVLDEESFGRLIKDRDAIYTKVAETFKALKSEGRVELVNFSSIIRTNGDLLERMLENDMNVLDQWVEPLRESIHIWKSFVHNYSSLINTFGHRITHTGNLTPKEKERHYYRNVIVDEIIGHSMHYAINIASYVYGMAELALSSSWKRKRKKYRDPLRKVLQAYLAYVNANMVISNELQLPFHDWKDFIPFYSMKFLSVGKDEDEIREHHEGIQKLFAVAFPDLAIHDTSGLLKALGDKRIEDLRDLISDAVAGKVEFDDSFAKAVLSEVFKCERKTSRFRNVLGYATLPIGFIPIVGTPAQKFVEEVIGIPVERKMKKKHRWFYLLSEIAGETTK